MFVLDRFLEIEGHLKNIYIYNINLMFNIKLRSMLQDDLRLRDKSPPPPLKKCQGIKYIYGNPYDFKL